MSNLPGRQLVELCSTWLGKQVQLRLSWLQWAFSNLKRCWHCWLVKQAAPRRAGAAPSSLGSCQASCWSWRLSSSSRLCNSSSRSLSPPATSRLLWEPEGASLGLGLGSGRLAAAWLPAWHQAPRLAKMASQQTNCRLVSVLAVATQVRHPQAGRRRRRRPAKLAGALLVVMADRLSLSCCRQLACRQHVAPPAGSSRLRWLRGFKSSSLGLGSALG